MFGTSGLLLCEKTLPRGKWEELPKSNSPALKKREGGRETSGIIGLVRRKSE